MSPKISVLRPYAAPCRRIDLVPSRRVAAVWVFWLLLVCSAVLGAVALPFPLRLIIFVVLAAANRSCIRVCILLLGNDAVRVLEWPEQGEFTILLGPRRKPTQATLARGSFRLGALLMLRFETPGGLRAVLIDGGRQEPRAFRQLCRRLNGRQIPRSGRSRKPS